ncbi:S1C family serine protease [Nostoc favosum]|uniref:Serine protease n=1 Tax=Nostoc favosum CHAB5714 TaxID=2780399 RepID=A0ABS8IM09_9NOSO|nr:serine protease [Nostoc favosum]MCC5605199.1 serine protease [Nostoc favosum CHAB5714]
MAGVYAYDDTKRFSHCSASASYKNGTIVYVSIDENYSWYLGFSNDSWRLEPNRKILVSYRFDRGVWFDAIGEFKDRGFFVITMPSDGTLIDLFRRGRQMDLKLSEGSYEFWLEGTFRLTASLARCVTEAKGGADKRTVEVQPPNNSGTEQPVSRDAPEKSSPKSGTGIVLSTNGRVLTNNHVVDQCSKIMVLRSGDTPSEAQLLRADPQNDLAVIKVDTEYPIEDLAVFRSGKSVKAGETVSVFGFPLAGTLSIAGNISSGNVTALSGIGDDVRYLQISAPVQPGNSGGPLIDTGGLVAGVVTARLSDGATIASSGAIPQNVNFALKGSVATSFLEAHSLIFIEDMPRKELSLVEVAERAKKFSVLIVCK